jgi:hypothetical protein
MPCPLRFVLVGFSVAVATLALVVWGPGGQQEENEKGEGEKSSTGYFSRTRLFSILEYTNGVYVVNQGKKFWEAGGCVLYTFLTLIVSLIALTMLYVILPYVLSKEALSNFCPHHYIPYAYEMKSSYIAAKQYFFL